MLYSCQTKDLTWDPTHLPRQERAIAIICASAHTQDTHTEGHPRWEYLTWWVEPLREPPWVG